MIFSSLPFLFFFFIFFILIKTLNRKFYPFLIFSSSYLFYAYSNFYHSLIILYLCFLAITQKEKNFKLKYIIPLIILPLIFFKYSNFILDNLSMFFNFHITEYEIKKIPIGLSFITFTVIAYVVDLKKGSFNFKHSRFDTINYIFFFPQLIAGPILRPNQLLLQLKEKFKINKSNIISGISLFAIGLSKKIFIADTISEIIDPTFLDINSASSSEVFVAFFLFPHQIYFDFSGYTHMAIGLAIIFNIELPDNFNKPYLSSTITEFWKRWHITLSSWIRDYIYIPMGGSRVTFYLVLFNTIVAMTISGLWHGANYTFIIWGLCNGLIICVEKVLNYNSRKFKPIKIFINIFLVFNLWILFRCSSIENAINFYELLYTSEFFSIFVENYYVALISIFFISFQMIDKTKIYLKFFKDKIFIIYIALTIIIFSMIISGGQSQRFIYFDF
jgi:alginate O-acetyltransferase complex protein AlgI